MSDLHFDQINTTEKACINLVNLLIAKCLETSQVSHVSEINSDLIASLCKSITGHAVPDLLVCQNKIDEAHNVQAVIDMLSLDLLGISLSHISGEAVVSGNITAIFNLLQVLEGIMNLSTENNGQRILKRKVSRLKKRKSDTKQTSVSKGIEMPTTNSSDNLSSDIASDMKSGTLSSQSNTKRLKPAFSRTRLRIKDVNKADSKISNKSSLKESSISTSLPSHIIKIEPEQSNEKISAEKVVDKDTIDQVIFEKNSTTSGKSSSSGNIPHPPASTFSNQNDDFHSKYVIPSQSAMKRKISHLPRSSNRNKDFSIKQDVEKLLEENLQSKLKAAIEKNSSLNSRSSLMRRSYLQVMKNPLKKSHISPCRKSFLLPYALRRRSIRRTSVKPSSIKKQSNNQQTFKAETDIPSESSRNFIQDLLSEFPGIQLSPTIMRHIREKYQQHLLKLHSQVKTCLFQKPKTEIEAEKAAQRQHRISDILQKDIKEQQYLKEVREHKHHENEINYRLRDSRLKSVQAKQYCSEFQDEMRKKMQKRNIAEELIFERVFKEVINIQSEHVEHLCRQLKECGEEDAKNYLNYLASLENLYQSQFSLLSEKLIKEKVDAQTRIKAEKLALDKMQRDFQQTLKKEIRFMQKATVELIQDTHFRELDAEQFIEKMRNQYT